MRHKVKSYIRRADENRLSGVTLRLAVCVLSGCLWFLACADFDIWPFAWFAMVPTMWAIRGQSPKKAFLYAWVAGTVANAGGFYWINGLLQRFGNMPLVASTPLYLMMCAYQALIFAFWGWFLCRLQKRSEVGATWVGPVLIVALELVVPFIFPWYLAITQAWVVPVIQIADLTGPLGVSFLLLMVNGALYDLSIHWYEGKNLPWKRALLPAAGVMAAVLVYGAMRIHQYEKVEAQSPKVKVGVVQANVGIALKGKEGFAQRQLEIHQELSRELQSRGAELLVWPESSYPYPLPRGFSSDRELTPERIRVRRGFDVPVLFGTITVEWDETTRKPTEVYNSAVLLDEKGRNVGVFDKMYLLIFGEYIPFYDDLDFMKRFFKRHRMSHFNRGKKSVVFPFWHKGKKYRIGPLICYEDILPAFGLKVAALKPNLFVNVTNDAWFGETSEPYEHLALAVYRSVEHRIPMVRAVNTGVSAIIDSTGRVVRSTPAVGSQAGSDPGGDSAGAIRKSGYEKVSAGVYRAKSWPFSHLLFGEVALMPPPSTVYAAVGDLFGYLNLLFSLYLLLIYKRGVLMRLLKRDRGGGGDREAKKGAKKSGTKGRKKSKRTKKKKK